MLILKSFASERSVDSAPCGSYLSHRSSLYFHCASGFNTQILAYMLDSLVRVSRRVDEIHFVSIANPATSWPASVPHCRTNRTLFSYALGKAGHRNCKSGLSYLGQSQSITLGLKETRRNPPSRKLSATTLTDADPPQATGPPDFRLATKHKELDAPSRPEVNIARGMTGFQPFPVNNFKYFLTLFSKFFSSFPHGTCSLSVSRQYLALDELYHPFRAALPSNSTLRTHVVRG
jgi:hypothetical protein